MLKILIAKNWKRPIDPNGKSKSYTEYMAGVTYDVDNATAVEAAKGGFTKTNAALALLEESGQSVAGRPAISKMTKPEMAAYVAELHEELDARGEVSPAANPDLRAAQEQATEAVKTANKTRDEAVEELNGYKTTVDSLIAVWNEGEGEDDQVSTLSDILAAVTEMKTDPAG